MLSEAEFKVLRALSVGALTTQRTIAEATGLSVGSVNGHLHALREHGLVLVPTTDSPTLTPAGAEALASYRVDNAIILAAGFGSRFVPYTYEMPKGLLKIHGTPMIERQIEQLLAVGISDITLVVGYKKEMFDYLIDKYGVQLVFNPEYATKNNFVSLYYAREKLKNSYVLVSDNWIEDSIFNAYEYDSWICAVYYAGSTSEWVPAIGAHNRILSLSIGGEDTYGLIGPTYFSRTYSAEFRTQLELYYQRPGTDDFYFEHIIRDNLKTLPIHLNRQSADNVHEFETLAELRAYDESYREDANSEVMKQIAEIFAIRQSDIEIIGPLKEGMTNNSFLFSVDGDAYVFRLPGHGTDKLIDRAREKWAYELVEPLGLADEIIFFDGASGVKVSRFYEGVHVVDPEDDAQVARAMHLLRQIHEANLGLGDDEAAAPVATASSTGDGSLSTSVTAAPSTPSASPFATAEERRFDVGHEIAFYEELARGLDAIRYSDYAQVRAKADELLALREHLAIPEVLCHIDYVYTNVLLLSDEMRVIDWEYAGFADPIIDVAMFAIYAYYRREQADRALFHYLGRQPTRLEETRLYMYMALCGLLWSLWTEYKQGLGDEFGDYSLTQYRYMKDFYKILTEEGYVAEALATEKTRGTG